MRARTFGLFAIVALMLLAASRLPVELDEAYYWCWSRTPGASYLDHPPGIAWALRATTTIFGDGRLGLRIGALIAIAIVAIASHASAVRLAGRDGGLLALSTLAGASMIVVGCLPATPDPFQAAAIAIAAWGIVRGDRRGLVVAGIACGVALLFKHTSALIFAGAVLALSQSAEGRSRIAPLLLGLAITSPLLIFWISADLDGGSLAFQSQRVLADAPSRWWLAPFLLLGAMALTFGPAAAIAQVHTVAIDLRGRDSVRAALAGGSALLLLACGIVAGLGKGEINWALPALVFGLPALIADVVARPKLRPFYEWLTIGSAIVCGIFLLHVIHPFLPIPPAKDRTLRSAGLDEVARIADSMAEASGARVLIARRYQAASVLRQHLGDRRPVLALQSGRPSQFDRWPKPRLCPGEPAIQVLNHPGLAEELVGRAEAAGETRVIPRGRGDRIVEQWYVTTVRMIDASFCEGPL
jgi:hypothetical protein